MLLQMLHPPLSKARDKVDGWPNSVDTTQDIQILMGVTWLESHHHTSLQLLGNSQDGGQQMMIRVVRDL